MLAHRFDERLNAAFRRRFSALAELPEDTPAARHRQRFICQRVAHHAAAICENRSDGPQRAPKTKRR